MSAGSETVVLLVVAAIALVVAGAALGALVANRRRVDPAALLALESVSRDLGQMRSELEILGRGQDGLRHETQTSREASLRTLAEATQNVRADIGQAHKALAEVRALEQGRARQMEQNSESLRRLEAVVAGAPTRGAAGEQILLRALAQLPPDLLETNVAFGNKIVEYAIRLPGGRYLPIDSKWTSAASLQRLAEVEDHAERKKLVEQVAREVRARTRDMTKYLDPERTLAIGILALPDSAYMAAPEAHSEGYREGILLVPYTLALPYVLMVYRLALRFGTAVDTDQMAARVRSVAESLRRIDEEIEGRFSRALVQMANARDALRDQVGGAQRLTDRLLRTAENADEQDVPGRASSEPRLALVDRD